MTNTTFALIKVFSNEEKDFRGNTSVVIMADKAWSDEDMQHMASDWNQPATTFLFARKNPQQYDVRWFAPDAEIDLCGHGSLAAFACLHQQKGINEQVSLHSGNGKITGQGTAENTAEMILDAIPTKPEAAAPDLLSEALGTDVIAYFPTSNKHIVVVQNENAVRNMKPDFAKLRKIDVFGYCVTAPGDHVDFVSRTLVPHVQQLEDHATGSSHAALAPFWAKRLGKNEMLAHQLSPRGGSFHCKVDNSQVSLGGDYRILATGQLQ